MARSPSSAVDSWPAVEYETLPWSDILQPGEASRSQRKRYRGPYRAAVLQPIARRELRLSDDVLAESEDAATEIARFDTEMGGELAPFEAVLLRSESAASSQIENLSASARAIAEAEIGIGNRRNAQQIVANTRTMDAALRLADHLDEESIRTLHRTLMARALPDRAGQWRDQQVWIGGGDLGPHGALFVPPRHERVPQAMSDLLAFVARDDLPVLAQAAVAHAQFETVHPFTDGNGRTGRALVHAMLKAKELARHVTVPVSAGLLTDTDSYFVALTGFRDGHPEQIVRRLAAASFAAITNGRQLVAELRAVRHAWAQRLSARRDSAAWRVVDLVLRHPVVNAPFVARELSLAQPNTYRHIGSLERADILVEFTDKRRHRVWRAPEVLDALDDFAVRAGRRTSGTT